MDTFAPEAATNNFRAEQNAQHAVLSDRSINSLTAALAAQLAKGKETEFVNNQTNRLAMGAVMRQFGHDPYALMQGATNLTAGATPVFTSNLGGVKTDAFTTGVGGISDQFARNIYDHVQKTYLTMSGAGRSAQTAGMNLRQMGDVFNVMQSRGMMAGVNAGEITKNNETGKLELNTSKETFEKIDKQFQSVTKVLAATKQLFGSNGSMVDLAKKAEEVTGLAFSSNGPAAILQRLNSINSYSRRMGLSSEAAAQQIQEGTAYLQNQYKYSKGTAAALATTGFETSSMSFKMGEVTAARAAERGEYVAPRSIAELAKKEMDQQAAFLEETPQATVAMQLLQDRKGMSQDSKNKLNESLNNLKNAKSTQEVYAARDNIEEAIKAATGGASSADIVQSMGGIREVQRRLSGSNAMTLANTASAAMANRNVNILGDVINKQNLGSEFAGQFNTNELAQAANSLISGLGTNDFQNIRDALDKGKPEDALTILNNEENKKIFKDNGMERGADVLKQMIASSPEKAKSFLGNMQGAAQHEEIASTISAKDRANFSAKDKADRFVKQFGVDKLSTGSFQEIVSSLLGTTDSDITNHQKLRYLMNSNSDKIHEFDLKDFGQNPEAANKLNKIIGGYSKDKDALYKAYGVKPGDDAALSAAIKEDKGEKLNSLLIDNNVLGAKTAGEKLMLSESTGATEASKKLGFTAKAMRELRLEGVDSKSSDYEQQLKDRAAELENIDVNSLSSDKTAQDEAKTLSDRRLIEHSNKFAQNLAGTSRLSRSTLGKWVGANAVSDQLKDLTDVNSDSFKALQGEYKENQSGVLAMLKQAKDTAVKEGGNNKGILEALDSITKNLEGKSTGSDSSNSNKFQVAVLRVENSGGATMDMYRNA